MSTVYCEGLDGRADKQSRRSQISGELACDPELGAGQWRIHQVPVSNPYQTSSHEAVTMILEGLIGLGFYGDCDVAHAISRQRVGVEYANPATQALIATVPGVENWLELIPTAAALALLYNPDIKQLANGKSVSPEVRDWVCTILDAQGIRSRGEVVCELLTDEVYSGDTAQQWVSLACGAAQPVCQTLAQIKASGRTMPRVTLVDIDRSALTAAQSYAYSVGVEQSVDVRRMNNSHAMIGSRFNVRREPM